MKRWGSLVVLLISLGVSLASYQELYVRSHSLQAPFIDADLGNRYWEFGGSTVVSTNQYVRLTPDRQSKKGWLWSKMPFNYQHWVVDFEFKVEGQGSKVFGDGFAFWVTKERAETGPVFGNRDMFKGLGIFFDTYANSRHKYTFPYISAMIGDGHTPYSNDDDNEVNKIAGCEAQFRKLNHATKARVKYLLGTITFSLDIKGKNTWEECFQVEGVKLSGPLYIGFSGMTGDVADNHDIIRVTSSMITVPASEQKEYENRIVQETQNEPQSTQTTQTTQTSSGSKYVPPPKTKSNKESKSEKEGMSWLTIVMILVVVGFVGGMAFVLYSTQAKKRNKRF